MGHSGLGHYLPLQAGPVSHKILYLRGPKPNPSAAQGYMGTTTCPQNTLTVGPPLTNPVSVAFHQYMWDGAFGQEQKENDHVKN